MTGTAPLAGGAGRAGTVAAAAAMASAVLRAARGRVGGDPDPDVQGWPDRVRARLARTNYAGRPVTLAGGPALVAGAALGSLVGGDRAGCLAAVVPGAVGLADDLVGDPHVKGLAGHLGALRRGRVTSGSVKIAGLGAAALAVAALEAREGEVLLVLADAALVAGTANVVNLFDLRPGRALKVVALLGLPLAAASPRRTGPALAAALGAAAAVAPDDLAGRAMLGDCGAGAAGTLVGQAAVRALPPQGRVLWLAGAVALTLASERVSFSRVIDGSAPLRALDGWGRRPVGP